MFWMIKTAAALLLPMILSRWILAYPVRSWETTQLIVPIQQSQHQQVNSEGGESRVAAAARVTGIILHCSKEIPQGLDKLNGWR